MYEYLEGTIQAIHPDATILDIGGVGYRILTPKTCSSRYLPAGHHLKLFVDLVVREDSHTLYGFASPHARDFFRLLQQVSGVGPKVALNIIGHAPVPELATTLFHKDTKTLTSVPGIGKKLAERLILELHEKIDVFIVAGTSSSSAPQAIQALQRLGFSTTEAREAIANAHKSLPEAPSVEQLIQHALSTKR